MERFELWISLFKTLKSINQLSYKTQFLVAYLEILNHYNPTLLATKKHYNLKKKKKKNKTNVTDENQRKK